MAESYSKVVNTKGTISDYRGWPRMNHYICQWTNSERYCYKTRLSEHLSRLLALEVRTIVRVFWSNMALVRYLCAYLELFSSSAWIGIPIYPDRLLAVGLRSSLCNPCIENATFSTTGSTIVHIVTSPIFGPSHRHFPCIPLTGDYPPA